MKISDVLRPNACTVCDCGHLEFIVLVRAMPNGNNHIIALRCAKCSHELAVPFLHGTPLPEPPEVTP